jgi:hypothetical protein
MCTIYYISKEKQISGIRIQHQSALFVDKNNHIKRCFEALLQTMVTTANRKSNKTDPEAQREVSFSDDSIFVIAKYAILYLLEN